MAVPGDNFSLTDVITEIEKYGKVIPPSLTGCFANAVESGFVGIGRDSLLDFAGYEEPQLNPPTIAITTVTLVPDARNRQDVTVTSNVDWVVTIQFIDPTTPEWALLGPLGSQDTTYSGTGNETFDIRYSINDSGSPRYLRLNAQTTSGSPTATDFIDVQQGEQTGL